MRLGLTMLEMILALSILIGSVGAGTHVLIQIKVADRRMEKSWIALQEVRRIAEVIRGTPWDSLDEQSPEWKLSSKCNDQLSQAQLSVDRVPLDDLQKEICFTVRLRWSDPNGLVGKPIELSVWRFEP